MSNRPEKYINLMGLKELVKYKVDAMLEYIYAPRNILNTYQSIEITST
jgi:hypothetical protein